MNIAVYNDYDAMSRAAADLVAKQLAAKPDSVIVFPSGDSPTGTLNYIVADANSGKTDLSQCYFVGLDEWVGMDENDVGSCKYYLRNNFFSKLDKPASNVRLFDAKAADLEAECQKMTEFIANKGGIDIMMVGIGLNGHIGLNEPGTPTDLYAHLSELDPMTVQVGQKYFKEATALTGGITLGLKHFTEARQAVLIVSGAKKADIMAKSLEGEVTIEVPASIMQTMPNALILIDKDAASGLTS